MNALLLEVFVTATKQNVDERLSGFVASTSNSLIHNLIHSCCISICVLKVRMHCPLPSNS